MQDLTISFLQLNTHWENISGNLKRLDELVQELPSATDLLVLPETFSTGFTMEPEKWAETMEGKAVQWMTAMAKRTGAVISGSLVIEEEGLYYNRFVFAHPHGRIEHYNKRHLFSLAGEHECYTKGSRNIQLEIKGWKIRPQVCYDLRFPVWSKNNDAYDVLLYTANWPAKRIAHWRSLLIARAIENQSFVLGVNRFGEDGNSLSYNGNSMLVNPMGEVQTEVLDREVLETVTLRYKEIENFRNFLSVLGDSDDFEVK